MSQRLVHKDGGRSQLFIKYSIALSLTILSIYSIFYKLYLEDII